MPVNETRVGLLKENSEMESGFEICGELLLKNSCIQHRVTEKDVWDSLLLFPVFDKLILFSTFKDKNGRVLKEGDILQTRSGMTKMTLSLAEGVWLVDVKGDKTQLYTAGAEELEYTGSIYEKKEG